MKCGHNDAILNAFVRMQEELVTTTI